MNRWPVRLFLIAVALLSWPINSPAPLIYREGEGWVYEKVGGDTKWMRTRAKDQLQVAQEAFDNKSYGLAMRAARRTVAQWEFSDYAPQAQYLEGRCEEARGRDQVAFKSYQKLIEKYPKIENYQEIVDRQFAIANRLTTSSRAFAPRVRACDSSSSTAFICRQRPGMSPPLANSPVRP